MGIKYDYKRKDFNVSYSRRHPVTRQSRGLRRTGIKTRGEAEKVYKRLILELGEKFDENLNPFWTDVVTDFLEFYANCGIAKNTLKNYQSCLEIHTFVKWQGRRIDEISTSDIREVILEDLSKHSDGHKKNMLKYFRAVYRYAADQEIVLRDPSPRIKFKKNEKIKKMLKEDELKLLLVKAKEQNNVWFPVWAVACYTGLRNGELYALHWENVDFDKRLIYITHSWNKINGLKETKSGDDRVVEIANTLMPLIKELYENRTHEYILPRIRAWETGSQSIAFKEFLKANNLPLVRFHDLRASWATIMLSKGIEPIKVMSMGGWKDLKTMQIYVRKSGIQIQGITDRLDFL
jgi:integrase